MFSSLKTCERNSEYSDFMSSYMDLTRQQCSFPGKECVLPPTALMVCSMHGHKSPRASQCFLSSRLLRLCPLSLSCNIIRQQNGIGWETGEQLWADAMSSKWPLLISNWSISGPRWSPTPWSPSSSSLSTRVSLFNLLVSGSRRRDSSRLVHRYFCQRENKKIFPWTQVNLENVISKTIVPQTSL